MFTQEQLDVIKACAKKCKNQGEFSVYVNLGKDIYYKKANFTRQQWDIIKYCAEECKRQHSGEMSVYDMLVAWDFASDFVAIAIEHNEFCADVLHFHGVPNLTIEFIEQLGKLVEPIDNKNGFRTIPIFVGNAFFTVEKTPYWEIEERLKALLLVYYEGILFDQYGRDNGWHNEQSIDAKANNAEDMFYLRYEDIHPFRDGNGRTGKILFNYLKGTLDNPQMPPNFWGSSNP